MNKPFKYPKDGWTEKTLKEKFGYRTRTNTKYLVKAWNIIKDNYKIKLTKNGVGTIIIQDDLFEKAKIAYNDFTNFIPYNLVCNFCEYRGIYSQTEYNEKYSNIDNLAYNKLSKGGIYAIENENDEILYIGSTSNFERRFQEHKECFLNPSLQPTMKLYKATEENLKIVILFTFEELQINCNKQLTSQYIQAMEYILIREHKPKYNIAGIDKPFLFNK